jgi:hypothetical protein
VANATPDITSPGGQVTPVTLVTSGQATLLVDILATGTPVAFVANGPATPVRYSSGTASSFFSAVTAAGGTVSAPRQTLYNNLFASLVSTGVMPKLLRLGILAAENVPSARVDLVTNTLITIVAAPTFTVDQGYASAVGNYVDTNGVPPVSSQDTLSFGVGMLTARVAGADVVAIGSTQSVGGSGLYIETTGAPGVTLYSPNTSSIFAGGLSWTQTDTKGFWHANRSGPSANAIYRNGVSIGTNTVASATPLPYSFILGAYRNTDNVSIYAYDTGVISAWFMGTNLTATDAANLSTAINTYMTAIGSPLY